MLTLSIEEIGSMKNPLVHSSRTPGFLAFSLGLVALVFCCLSSYGGDQQQNDAETGNDNTLPVAPQTAEEVAQEILRIQTDMGGSIVETSPVFDSADSIPPISPAPRIPPASQSDVLKRIGSLRNAAWQLDSTAHKLEIHDLYDQADALRELATSLRQDARQLKAGISI